jgi:hypothetical protein
MVYNVHCEHQAEGGCHDSRTNPCLQTVLKFLSARKLTLPSTIHHSCMCTCGTDWINLPMWPAHDMGFNACSCKQNPWQARQHSKRTATCTHTCDANPAQTQTSKVISGQKTATSACCQAPQQTTLGANNAQSKYNTNVPRTQARHKNLMKDKAATPPKHTHTDTPHTCTTNPPHRPIHHATPERRWHLKGILTHHSLPTCQTQRGVTYHAQPHSFWPC